MNDYRFEQLIRDWLRPIEICCRRIILHTKTPCSPSVSMIRGVWGRALHHLDIDAYHTVFQGTGAEHLRQPSYMIRSSENGFRGNQTTFHLNWITWGKAIFHDRTLCRAWDVASGMGVCKERIPFAVEMSNLDDERFSLADVSWPIPGTPATSPFRLSFPVPLRIVRKNHAIMAPTLSNLTEAAIVRLTLVRHLIEGDRDSKSSPQGTWPDFAEAAIALSTTIPSTLWRGREQNLIRYSSAQQDEVKMKGTTGYIDFPEGVGPLWPLFAAARWLHLGKGTSIGMGQPGIVTIH